MKLVALTTTRNGAWSLKAVITAALRWCDEAIIFDHCSTDRTPEIIGELEASHPGRIHRMGDGDPIWHEMRYRQMMLERAREVGATHCAIVDDDEILTENLVGEVRAIAQEIPPRVMFQPAWLMCWRSLDEYREGDSSVWCNSWVSWIFRMSPELAWFTPDGYDHHHRDPYNIEDHWTPVPRHAGGVFHIQHANWRRLLAKQAWYQMIEMVRWPKREAPWRVAAKYSRTVSEENMRLQTIPPHWWGPERAMIDLEAEPWQEAECRAMLAKYGKERFAGLNLFGVVDNA